MRILVADDTLAVREFSLVVLGKAGYEVDTARDGEEALDMARGGGYDLVLMDLDMPVMDGRDATDALREAGERVPILAMTAHSESYLGDMPGFDGYLAKPVRREGLLRAVEAALGLGIATAQVVDSASSSRRLDRETLEGFHSDVGAAAFLRLVGITLDETRKRLNGLAEELEAGRLDVIERYAHDIKACAGSLGAWDLHEAAFALERAAAILDGDGAATGVRRVTEAAGVLREIEVLRDELSG